MSAGGPERADFEFYTLGNPHYTMGGLWVHYDLQATLPGLFVTGEANFSDHGADRLDASALMQGLADGYFVLPATISDYLASGPFEPVEPAHPAVREAIRGVREGIERLLAIDLVRELRDESWRNPKVPGRHEEFNQTLERAGRVADFFVLGELMCIGALHREESCGCPFRVEHQTEDGEALRDDAHFGYVAAWESGGPGRRPVLHREDLRFEYAELAQRSYR